MSAYFNAPIPGLTTLENFLRIALLPVGNTMYIYGGGWNETDDGSGEDGTRLGCNPAWQAFFLQQGADYDFHTTRYQLGKGLDCSGYVGWCLYNLFHTVSGQDGYVMKAANMASTFAQAGWGSYLTGEQLTSYQPGDIISMPGHVWISLGSCADHSVVLLHSSPCGVQIGATPTPQGTEESQALALANHYMKCYFPLWHQKYPHYGRGLNYLTQGAGLRWQLEGGSLTDPSGFAALTAPQVLNRLLDNPETKTQHS